MMRSIGVLGGGQLGLMMVLEGRRMGIRFNVYDEKPDAPALRIADAVYSGDDWVKLINDSDVITVEFEHVNPRALELAHEAGKLRPSLNSIIPKQDKIKERLMLSNLGLPTPRFMIAHGPEDIEKAYRTLGKLVVKVPNGAYDGKGQFYVTNEEDLPAIPVQYPLLVDEFINIEKEVSVILARAVNGEVAVYPITENHNHNGMLLYSRAPANINEDLSGKATELAVKLANSLNYVGVLAVEFFLTKDQELLINEYAPRVHNTGHWTLSGAVTSQFENHLRAILGLPLGNTRLLKPTAIVNMIGVQYSEELINSILKIPGTRVWWYGKSQVRPRRKMGHVTIVADNDEELTQRIRDILSVIYGSLINHFIPPWDHVDGIQGITGHGTPH
ncbi:5-(carboxyamino)imidazole ribonucleotide synthase [Caldivirga maquilingensis]|uniref:N5-carboxyaminoimidazole ribonucleotide synthase n=1 Tax=Caldivirga maquilingensis (strain ATCC 700844 / DSM 13496 / JCM 10307 / IC-167) TaxID=397948 RepID=A8MCK4_CALMQ|nr:5-(carboxyamino)imidazole ribonucleotide synthase [Caldivirga maquilingensis]ABW01510.1 phosphoribosylaminoimidazole carboxylase, ATPase subunit [Caldivirga maquilingensis IC-167]